VCKSSCPSKDRSNAVRAGFASFLVNTEMAGNCAMGSLSFDGLTVRAHLHTEQISIMVFVYEYTGHVYSEDIQI
jgi:hypothetical protein